eukprot:s4_g19.t1
MDFAFAFATYDSANAHGGHLVATAWLQAPAECMDDDLIRQAAAVAESSGSADVPPAPVPAPKASALRRTKMQQALRIRPGPDQPEHVLLRNGAEAQSRGDISKMPASVNGKVMSSFMKNGAALCGAYQTNVCQNPKGSCPGRHACAVMRASGRACGGSHPACECHDRKFLRVEHDPTEGVRPGPAQAKASSEKRERPSEPATPPPPSVGTRRARWPNAFCMAQKGQAAPKAAEPKKKAEKEAAKEEEGRAEAENKEAKKAEQSKQAAGFKKEERKKEKPQQVANAKKEGQKQEKSQQVADSKKEEKKEEKPQQATPVQPVAASAEPWPPVQPARAPPQAARPLVQQAAAQAPRPPVQQAARPVQQAAAQAARPPVQQAARPVQQATAQAARLQHDLQRSKQQDKQHGPQQATSQAARLQCSKRQHKRHQCSKQALPIPGPPRGPPPGRPPHSEWMGKGKGKDKGKEMVMWGGDFVPWEDMVKMQRMAHEAAMESRQGRLEKIEEEKKAQEAAKRKAEEEETAKRREAEGICQAEFRPRFEAELQARESRRKEEEEQRKKEEEDKRAENAKGKESKGGKGSSNVCSPSSAANLQKREGLKIKDLLQTQEKNQAKITVLQKTLVEKTMEVQDR